jgi:hypothetical protein
MLVQMLLILRWYVARPSRLAFFCRMMAGTLIRLPAAVPQTFSYLAYFIHLREYADKVVARECRFNYALDDVTTSANRFGEGGVINMPKLEAQDDGRSRDSTNRHVESAALISTNPAVPSDASCKPSLITVHRDNRCKASGE